MRTAIVSDLHLGGAFGEDLLRDAGIRETLLGELSGADRVVLAGDIVELRELPLWRALEAARPFFQELGGAMAGREVTIVPGNHDHRLVEPLLDRVAEQGRPIGLEERDSPAGEPNARIAEWLGEARLGIAYPGLSLREDVYVTHGHYLDCHMSLPRIECLAAAGLIRFFGPIPDPAEPADYERVLRPIYGLSYALAQVGESRPDLVRRTRPSETAWRRLSSRDSGRGRARRAALRLAIGTGFPLGVWTANRLLRAEFDSDLSEAAITRSGIEGAVEMARRLRVDSGHVIVGHTHRAGPREGEPDWPLAGGGRLHNTGSWVFASAFHRPGTPPGPYWPGTVTWLEDDAAPRRVHLLEDRSHDELRAVVRRSRAGI